jgi:FixJ family two-component response regulator
MCQVLGGAPAGEQIAAELGIRKIAVKAHRGRGMREMQVDFLADLVRVAAALDPPAQRA